MSKAHCIACHSNRNPGSDPGDYTTTTLVFCISRDMGMLIATLCDDHRKMVRKGLLSEGWTGALEASP